MERSEHLDVVRPGPRSIIFFEVDGFYIPRDGALKTGEPGEGNGLSQARRLHSFSLRTRIKFRPI